MIELTCCPSTLQKGFSTYSPVALKELFNSQKVNHILPYNGMDNNETEQKERRRRQLDGHIWRYGDAAAVFFCDVVLHVLHGQGKVDRVGGVLQP